MPIARAPEPTGLGEEAISICCADTSRTIKPEDIIKQRENNADLKESIITLLFYAYLIKVSTLICIYKQGLDIYVNTGEYRTLYLLP
jgi:hypothetical protein